MSAVMQGVLLLALCSFVGQVSACGRSTPPRDHDAPSLSCPSDMTKIADPKQLNTMVTWSEPKAYDKYEGRSLCITRTGPGPGLFSNGTTRISYSVKDNSGNCNCCNFKIIVKVIRCKPWKTPSDGWKQCHPSERHPSDDMRYGAECRFGCYAGHTLVGESKTTCGNDSAWTTADQPYCKKRSCDKLYPIADQQNIVNIKCTDGVKYRSQCSYMCSRPGYSVRRGHSKVRVCTADGTWLGATPICIDTQPPRFTNCPLVKTVYADENKTSAASVYIDSPDATDNSDEKPSVVMSGPALDSELKVGEYEVKVTAKDTAENRATCRFKLIVKQILCPKIFPLPYTSVTCPNGRIYGSTCEFKCDNGSESNFQMRTYCGRNGEKYFYGLWNFGNYQPYYERQNNCPDLRPPDNGALACDTWYAGRYCRALCQHGYTVYEPNAQQVHTNMLVCGDSGRWFPPGDISNCEKTESRRRTKMSVWVSYGYFSGPCVDAQKEIRQKFFEHFKGEQYPCQPPECGVAQVKVICGDTGKRDVDTILRVKVDLTLSANMTYADVIMIREKVKQNLTEAWANLDLDLEIDNYTLSAEAVVCGQPEVDCPEGSVPDKTKPLTCVQCGPGFYQDNTAEPGVCRKCPIGSYQVDHGQTSCVPCPVGMTTEKVGDTQCKEACPRGQYSPKGTVPCSPCDLGKYSDVLGTRECSLCPGSKTTLTAGSTSELACFEFDVFFTGFAEDAEFMAPYVVTDMTSAQEFGLAMWLQCDTCGDVLNITDGTGATLIKIHGGDALVVETQSEVLPVVNTSIASSNWRYLYLAWFPHSVGLYLDGELVTNGSHSLALPQTLNVGFGGRDFVGSITQLHVFSVALGGPETKFDTIASVGLPAKHDTCLRDVGGDLLSWRSYANLDGNFVNVKSNCDAIDNCLSTPCENNGTCFDAIGGFTCACADGFTGSECSVNIDDCEVSVCDNNGTCVDAVDGYMCNCTQGFRGDLCEIQVVDGTWGEFDHWSLCSVTCGTGRRVRHRACDNPEPSNGGKQCEGPTDEVRECIMAECVYECDEDPEPLVNGSLNCGWENATRRCFPACDEGFDFDSDLFVIPSNVYCGPETGNLWNIRSPDNPWLQLPTCQEIAKGKKNILFYTAEYGDLFVLGDDVRDDVTLTVAERANHTHCVSELGRCHVDNIDVTLKDRSGTRQERSTLCVTFTVTISCDIITDINECYVMLKTVVDELNDLVSNQSYTITHDDVNYDVTVNSTSIGGTTVCNRGYVPVVQYCVPCGEGMYENGEFCERCAVGYYQDEAGQQTCKQCPEGWTTEGLQTRNASLCNVEIDTKSGVWIIVVAVAGGCIACALVIVAAYLYKAKMTGHLRFLAMTPGMDDHSAISDYDELNQGPAGQYKVFDDLAMSALYPAEQEPDVAVKESGFNSVE